MQAVMDERQGLDELAAVDPYAPGGLRAAVDTFRQFIGAEHALAYRPVRNGAAWALDLAATSGWSDDTAITGMFAVAFPRMFVRRFGLFDPAHPEPGQRNRSVRYADLKFDIRGGEALFTPIGELYRRLSILRSDQLRVLVCDGPRLVAWVGGWRVEPFTVEERERVGRAVHVLRRRIALEASLLHAGAIERVLERVLEQWTTPAALVDRGGRVVHRNQAARHATHGDRCFAESLRRAVERPTNEFDLFPIRTRGVPDHLLVVRRPIDSPDLESRFLQWVERHRLTARQAEVFRLLVEGCSNREIGERLGIARGTAELHVSAVLGRVGVPSRTRLLSSFELGRA